MEKKTMVGVEIPEIEIRRANIKIIGDSPLIVHKWSEKAKKEMLDKQMKKATKGREAKDPERDFYDSLYWLTEEPKNPKPADLKKAKFGFPAVAFKACAINAGYQQGLIAKKTTARGGFHIDDEMVEIIGMPTMREDMVRVGAMIKAADIRYRAEFKEWSAVLNVKYNPNAISIEQIVSLLNIGGFANGVGEWRPEKDGSFGTFHVARQGE